MVLRFLKTIPNNEEVPLKDLTLKTVMLTMLVSAQRGQTIHQLSIDDMRKTDNSIVFMLSKPIKQSKPGSKPVTVELSSYTADLDICVVTTLNTYLDHISLLRGSNKQLFISYLKPYNAVSRSTISRWIKIVMINSGINVQMFKPHSTRAAATSKAYTNSVPLEQILSTAGWSSATTFGRFYNKPVRETCTFASGVLQ